MRSRRWLIDQLPIGMVDDDFFVRFVGLFQTGADTLAEGADTIEHVADVTLAPESMVRWLGSWIGVHDLDPTMPSATVRHVVAASSSALAWRGTPYGVRLILEMLTGEPAQVLEGGGVWPAGSVPDDTAWMEMTVTATGPLTDRELATLIADEVPAHVQASLAVAAPEGRRVIWTSERTDDVSATA